jgi:large subunit ribosomal protein L23
MVFPFFKKQKKKEKKAEKPKEEPLVKKSEKIEISKPKQRKKTGMAYGILESLHVTEKATDLSKNNQYVFKIFPKANKPEIKKAIEEIFNVDVVGVNIIKTPSKRRRLGRTFGWRKGYKKAIVKIKQGQKIDILPK